MATKDEDDVCGGYDVSFVAPLEKDYECPACLLAVRNPVQTPCGHSFCKTCFDQVAQQQGGGDMVECPLDKQKLAKCEVFKDMKVERKVLSLKVKCTNKAANKDTECCLVLERPNYLQAKEHPGCCRWVGELNCLQDHLKECRFMSVQCPNECGTIVDRCDISDHVLYDCVRRLLTCSSCKQEVEEQHMKIHTSSCPKIPIDCTLQCGNKVQREKMKYHVSDSGDCPNTMLPCVFKDTGCDAMIKRHEMDNHLTTAVVQHQIKQQQTLNKQQQMLNKQQQIITRLSDKNQQLQEKMRFLERVIEFCSGQAILRFSLPKGNFFAERSRAFLTHPHGYKAQLSVFSRCPYLAYVYAALCLVNGDRDDKLGWPFKLRHTIAVVSRQHMVPDIKATIDPTTLDDELSNYCFRRPFKEVRLNRQLEERRLKETALGVSRSDLFSDRYMKDGEIVFVVEVNNY